MSENSQRWRILVGVDLSAGSIAAAELTTEIASALDAEVCGLFVEEDDLLVLAAHPLVRELDTWSAATREIDTARLERRMRAQGYRARDRLVRLAARRGVPCSFQTMRGPATAAIREASHTADIVTLGRVGWSPGEKQRLGGTVRELLAKGERAILIPGARPPLGAPVVVCCEWSEGQERTVAIAAELSTRMKAPLSIKVLSNDPLTDATRARIATVVATFAPALEAPTIATTSVADLDRSLRARAARLVILGRGSELDGPALAKLATEVESPMLVISAATPARQPLAQTAPR